MRFTPYHAEIRSFMPSDQISTFFLNIYRHKSLVLIQFHLIPIGTKLFWPSTKLDWSSATKYHPVQPHTDSAPPNTNQYRLLLTRCYHVSTGSASYWPSNIIYQPVPPYSDNQNVWHFMEEEPFAHSFFQDQLSDFLLSTWDEYSWMLV